MLKPTSLIAGAQLQHNIAFITARVFYQEDQLSWIYYEINTSGHITPISI